ncbi:Spo11/DNA topoisomerase VI subunit A [Mycena latifolia]|nr:Spo11/DNA topoisomerase VI subunit A [Mycena latifolia]
MIDFLYSYRSEHKERVVQWLEGCLLDLLQQLFLPPETTRHFSLVNRHGRLIQATDGLSWVYPRRAVPWTSKDGLVLLRFYSLIELLLYAIQNNFLVTLRWLWYRLLHLFDTPEQLNSFLDDLIAAAGLRRPHFNIGTRTSGRMIFEGMTFLMRDGFDWASFPNLFSIIPEPALIQKVILSPKIKCLVVCEGHCTLQAFASAGFHRLGEHHIIAISTSGQPDIVTRRFIKWLSELFPWLLIVVVTDGDAGGLQIALTLKHGGEGYRHEGVDTPNLCWLGLLPSQFQSLALPESSKTPLTKRDRRRLRSFRRKAIVPEAWQRQALIMERGGFKVDIGAVPIKQLKTLLQQNIEVLLQNPGAAGELALCNVPASGAVMTAA